MSNQPPYYPEQPSQQPGYGSGPGYPPPATQYTPNPYPNPNQYQDPNQYQNYAGPQAPDPGSGQALAGLILGIVCIVLCWIPVINLIIGVLGLIFSIIGRKSVQRHTIAIVGIVLSIIGLVFSICDTGLIITGILAALSNSANTTNY
ncbi:hypothetical protein [Tengunoibacter tsumagoiensis]|uniref:DUF4190 domain-containing protein n=1 Tax=Tengunoibacter tsumagoiensis TaxID=2014871 RepID=A0A401ZZK1_9CHLR|nr:hypothetical protein [Tengunoibacter tsumagoiensis]GCE12290.1 hypothetical protein KTT_21490 [Tengunoibacter tsumagoiensis]